MSIHQASSTVAEEGDWLRSLRTELPLTPLAAVFGSSVVGEQHDGIADWRCLGRLLVQNGYGLLNGGYQGSMSLIGHEVIGAGGVSVGITSRAINDSVAADAFSLILEVDTVFQRLEALIRLPQIFIALPGGVGTLVEIASAFWFMDRGFIPRRPIVLLGDTWDSLRSLILSNPLMFRSNPTFLTDLIITVGSPEELDRALFGCRRCLASA